MEEKEYCFTGYCRQIDQGRMVMVEIYDGEAEPDCCYATCQYAPNCPIAQQIQDIL